MITLTDVKTYNNLTTTSSDALINTCVSASINYVENYCNRSLTSGSYEEYFRGNNRNVWFLKNKPINGIESIEYRSNYVYTPMISGSIRIDTDENRLFLYDYDFLSYYDYKIIYSAGYTTETVPYDLKRVLIEIATYLYLQSAKAGVGRLGLDSSNISSVTGESTSYLKLPEMNDAWKITLDKYKRFLIN